MTERKESARRAAKPAAARRAEVDDAAAQNISFSFDGERYELEPIRDWDLDVMEAIEDERYVAAVRAMLGPKQWARFKSKRRTMTDLLDIFGTAEKAAGVRPGE